MSDNIRRKLLKSVAIGSGAIITGKTLPENWTKPVVDSVLLPAHAQATTCTPCLDAASYCAGSGGGSLVVSVAVDGTVTVTHSVVNGTDTVDPCTGGDFSVSESSTGGNTVTISGTIPCGVTDSIDVIEDDGQSGPFDRTLTKANCT